MCFVFVLMCQIQLDCITCPLECAALNMYANINSKWNLNGILSIYTHVPFVRLFLFKAMTSNVNRYADGPVLSMNHHSYRYVWNDLFWMTFNMIKLDLNHNFCTVYNTYLTFGNCAAVVPMLHSMFSISDDILPLIISLLWCILMN